MRPDDDLYPFFKKLIAKHNKPYTLGDRTKKFGNSLAIGNPGYAKCQPKGSKVLMADGTWKNIEDIIIGDRVKSLSFSGKLINCKVLSLKKLNEETYFILNKKRKIRYSCSSGHLIPVLLDEENNLISNLTAKKINFKFKDKIIRTLKYCFEKGVCFEEVIIEPSGKDEDQYGINIDSETEWYITDNGFITHNTSGNKREIELRYALGHKVFCLYDGGTRMDMAYFMFKSNSKFWAVPKLERGTKIVTARPYPTELLFPISNNLPSRIPNPGRPFTIAVSDITEEDLSAILGSGKATDSAKIIFKYLKKKVKEDTTPEDFLNYLGLATKQVDETDNIKLSHHGVKKLKEFFTSLMSEGLLSSKKAETAIDFRQLIKDKRTISTLILRHIPESYWGFLVHFFMKHISNTLAGIGDKAGRKINQKTSIVLNEVADLLDEDDEKGSASSSIKTMVAKIQKQSRTFDIFMLLDTQLPQELPVVANTMKRIYVYNSSISAVEKAMEIIGVSTRSGEITRDDLMIIPRLAPGWYYLFDRDDGVSIHKQVWTRSRTYEDGEDFYDIYDKVYGKGSYYNVKELLSNLKKESEESLALWRKRFGVKKIKIDEDGEEVDDGDEDEDDELTFEEYDKLKDTF